MKYIFQCKLMHVLAHVLNWHYAWDFQCPRWTLLWRSMRTMKEGTCGPFCRQWESLKLSLQILEFVLGAWFKQECVSNAFLDGTHLSEMALHIITHLGLALDILTDVRGDVTLFAEPIISWEQHFWSRNCRRLEKLPTCKLKVFTSVI
jgi:hypothetical protein